MAQVTCTRCGQTAEGLPRVPLAGTLGQEIVSNVCATCWKDWQQESFRLINHHGLQPVDRNDRQRLFVYLREYLKLPAASQ